MNRLLTELVKQEDKLLNCVHCGFCLPVCPTYTRLGDEADSPRGRLHFMRAVVDGRLDPSSVAFGFHLDRCLGCRACESVCPSGVEYGHLLEGAREVVANTRRPRLLDRLLPSVMASGGLRRPLMLLSRFLRWTGIPRVVARRLPSRGRLGQVRLGMGMVAATAPSTILRGNREGRMRGGSLPGESPQATVGETAGGLGRGERVAVLLGCVQEGLLGRVNRATARVLEVNGYEVAELRGQSCCGAIHAHTGDLEGARRLARTNIGAFEAAGLPIVAVNAAGCGAIMKEYPLLLAEDDAYSSRAAAMAEKVRDVSELLGREGIRAGAPVRITLTYDSPCHLLHAQKIHAEPLFILTSIPGVRVAPLDRQDECCGGAGVYGITHPDLGGAIGKDKVDSVLATGAEMVVTGNPGCMMQIGAWLTMSGSTVEVAHPVEVLDESYRRAGFYDG